MSAEIQQAVTIRTVKWCNTWNRARAYDTDGAGTKTHLTASAGVAGQTLCGKTFPKDKGYPSSWGAGTCKKCLKKSGLTSIAGLASVPSVEDW